MWPEAILAGRDSAVHEELEKGLLRIQAVFCFIPHHALRTVDEVGRDLLAAMGRQCMKRASILASRIMFESTCQSSKSRFRSSFLDSNPMLVHTSVFTRSAPRAAFIGSENCS